MSDNTKIISALTFPDQQEIYKFNATTLNGETTAPNPFVLKVGDKTYDGTEEVTVDASDLNISNNTDNLVPGNLTWFINCGTATTVID